MSDKDDIFFDFDDSDFLEEESVSKPKEKKPEEIPDLDFDITGTDEDKPAVSRRRSSQDFERDMDTLLITAQSSMIIEGLRYLTGRDYSSHTMPIYLEAMRGVELFITLLERDPLNYKKLSKIFNTDIDCQRIEKVTLNLYNNSFNEEPTSDVQWIRAFELLKDNIERAYIKSSISCTMLSIKKFFLFSGGLDQDKLHESISSNPSDMASEIQKLIPQVQNAIGLLKTGKGELSPGMKGKDMNIFIIKASQLISAYFRETGQLKMSEYYNRINETYKKYFVVR